MPASPAEHDVQPFAEAFSDLANAMQTAVLIAADLERQLRESPERDELARLRAALSRAVAATTRLALELHARR